MWLFTRHGFFSVVQAQPEPAASTTTGQNAPEVMVRARQRQHLVNLKEKFPNLATYQILFTPGRDYLYRMVIPQPLWIEVVRELAEDVTYPNFKDAAKANPRVGPAYQELLDDIWNFHYWFQHQSWQGPVEENPED